ncbi:lipopolysaccharide biosynthesis protein [Shinella sp. CPCC 101442]|uniref:lipopolysaccharide biosynthesis protein n=1 Tax=Shinella sp. CPCC 101442 TaxID=2932265 RepID=UPI002153219B|nr:lipopolysaccharide biosynthesis protein [Shinella sp. CPCC 101442]MCR6497798.1 lipopolysaccharide biosynthesis protein [Shinella sp. CPCC 101442]
MTSVLGSSLLNLAATLVSLVAGFLVSVITARVLGPAGSGLVAYAMWVIVCAAAVADRGFPQLVLRYVAAVSDRGDNAWAPLVRRAFTVFLPAVAVAFLLFLAYGVHHHVSGAPASWLWIGASLLFLAYTLSAFSIAVARGRGRFGEVAATTVVGSLFQVPVVFAGAVIIGPGGALLGMLTRYLPQVFCLARHLDRRTPAPPAALTPEMHAYRRSMWTNDAIDIVVLTRIEFLVVGYFLGDADIGYFAAAIVFSGLVSQLTLQLSPAFLVGLAARAATDGAAPPSALYRNCLRFAALFVMPLGIGGAAIIPALIPVVFGADFAPAANAGVLFMLASVPAGLAVVPWSYLAAREQGNRLLRVTVASAVLVFILLVIAVPSAGLLGAGSARIIAESLTLGLLLMAVGSHGGPTVPWGALARTFVAASACGGVAFAVTILLPGPVGLPVAVALGALVYAVAARMLRLIASDEAARIVDMVEGRLPGGLRPLARRIAGLIAPAPGPG